MELLEESDPWILEETRRSPQNHYYATCAVGGFLASTNRWMLTPIDVIKCNMQAHPNQYPTFRQSIRVIYRENGLRGFTRGFRATALAYGMQTATKYTLYEVFKDQLNAETKWGFLLAAGAAEVCATVLLCPPEMCKVALQTNPQVYRATRGQLWLTMQYLYKFSSFPFGSLGPLWCRQIPATMANFVTFETTVDWLYQNVFTEHHREDYSRRTQLGVTLLSGYTAGVTSAIISHPADSLVNSQWNKTSRGNWYALATRGLAPRCFTVGTVVGLQWWLYDSFRTYMGLGTSGGRT